jgi:3-oxoacyl-[acyl-carrier protein] reductase
MSEARVALIAGSSSGLGSMIARALAAAGWHLCLNSRHEGDKIRQLRTECETHGVQAFISAGDVTNRTEIERVVEETMARFGRVDALIHTVGPFIRERKWFVEHSPEEIEDLIGGNLLSAMWSTRAVLPHMRQAGWGRIILFGFGRAMEAPAWPDRSVYAAAKTGLVSFTKSLAVEEAPFGITVNMICPGDIVGEKKEMTIIEAAALTDKETPRGRPGSGEDVAKSVQFLLQESSDFVTGNMIQVTGGLDVIHPVSKRNQP